MPFFSVIIPVYKAEEYIHECIDSVLDQTFEDFELILVDDGSPDRCPQICDDYALQDTRVRVVHQLNAGAGAARNAGVLASTGEAILFLDSDDYWHSSDLLKKVHHVYEEKPDTDIVYFKSRKKCLNGQVMEESIPSDWSYNAAAPIEQFRLMVRYDALLGSPCMKAIRRAFLTKNNIQFPLTSYLEDIPWDLRLASALPRNQLIDECLHIYREVPNSRSSQKQFEVYLGIVDYCSKLECQDKETEFIVRSYGAYYYITLCIQCAQSRGRVYRELLKDLNKRKAYLQYNENKKVEFVRKISSAIGFPLTIWAMRLCFRLRKLLHKGQ